MASDNEEKLRPDYVFVGKRISHLRSQRNWSQEDLAEAVGISPLVLEKLERGSTRSFDGKMGESVQASVQVAFFTIARALGVSLGALFEAGPDEPITPEYFRRAKEREAAPRQAEYLTIQAKKKPLQQWEIAEALTQALPADVVIVTQAVRNALANSKQAKAPVS